MDGDHHCHLHPAGAGGTFGAEELQVLLPGAAELLQGWIFGLEALELLQAVLQAPRSLQHRSGVCGQQGWWSGPGDGHHRPHPTLVAMGTRVPLALSPNPKGSSHLQPAYKQGQSPRMPPHVPPHVPPCVTMCHRVSPHAPHHHPKAPKTPSTTGGASQLLAPKHGGTHGPSGPGPPSLGADNGILCRGKQVLSEPYVFPLSALHHH